jgi:uncharacterized protein with von Willebrand factor type A (vWA) domain
MFRLFEHKILSRAYSQGSGSVSTGSIFGSSKTEKINQFLMLMKDPDVQPIFRNYIENIIENVLATSDLQVLKRLTTIETVLELNDYPIEGDEAESTIPKQISLLSNQINEVMRTNNKRSIIEPIPESIHIGMSKTTARAILLFKDVIEVASEGKDQIVIGSREIKNYLTNHIQPEYRVGNVSNFRKVKKDVLTTLKKLLPDNVLLDKKKCGRQEIRLVYGT